MAVFRKLRMIRSLALAVASAAMLLVAAAPAFADGPSKMEKAKEELQQIADRMYPSALGAGMSVVVIPTINLDYKYAHDNAEYGKEFHADLTHMLRWMKVGGTPTTFQSGLKRDALYDLDIGITGTFFQYTHGPYLYQVYIVEPGTYNLVGQSFEIRETSAPQAQWTNGSEHQSDVGELMIYEIKRPKYYTELEWQDAQYRTDQVSGSYCTTVRMINQECVNWETWTQDVTTMTSQAGYYNRTRSKMVDAVIAEHNFARPFASFTVAPGEAVVLDGLYAEYPNADFNLADCLRQSHEKIRCSLGSVTLARLPGSLETFQSSDFARRKYANLAQVAAVMRYRELDMGAEQGCNPSKWGPSYILK